MAEDKPVEKAPEKPPEKSPEKPAESKSAAPTSAAPTNVEVDPNADVAGALSLTELDDLLLKEDPEFTRKLLEVQGEHAKSELNIEMIDLDQLLKEAESKALKARLKRLKTTLRAKTAMLAVIAQERAKSVALWSVASLKKLKTKAAEGLQKFSRLTLKQKVAAMVIFLMLVGTLFFIQRALTKGWIHEAPPPFMASLEEMAVHKYTYEPNTDMEPFYDSSRLVQNLFSLKRIVVNVRRSETSGVNPMGAFEFYLEGNSTEAIVEAKDRESETRDLFQRIIEEMSYDQLSSVEGKQLLLEKLRREVNKIFVSGQIRKIYIKTVVLKP